MKCSRITIACLIVFEILISWYANAQPQYTFRHYDTRDGLGSDDSFSIAMDSLGHIWISHINGLSRFDGYKFTIFKYEEKNPSRNALNLYGYVNLFTDLNGNIWILEQTQDMSKPKTLVKYDWRKDRFIKYQFDLKGAWLGRVRFVKDSPKIWLAASSKGLASYNTQTNESQIFESPNRACQSINDMKDMGDYLLLATDQGLWKFDKEKHQYSRPAVSLKDSSTLYNASIRTFMDNPYGKGSDGTWLKLSLGAGLMKISPDLSIIEQVSFPEGVFMQWYAWAPDETVWFTNWAKGGIHLYDTRKKKLTVIESDPADPNSLNSNDIREVAIDRNGNFWAPTDRGVSCLPLQNRFFENHKLPDLDFGSSLFEANGKQFLIVSQAKKMLSDRPVNVPQTKNILIAELNKNSAEDLQFQKINTDQVKGGGVAGYRKGNFFLWTAVIGDGGRVVGLPLNQSTGMIEESPSVTFQNEPGNSNTVPTIFNNDVWEDPANGNLWVAHWAQGLFPGGLSRISSQIKYGLEGSVTKFQHNDNDSSTLISNRPFRFFPQNEKSVWVLTTEGADLMHLEGNNEVRFEHVIDQGHIVNTMFKSSNGSLFFGSVRGLFQLTHNEATRKWSYSLAGNIGNTDDVSNIQEDSQGRLWFSGSDRLYCYDLSKKTFTYFTRFDGLEHMPLAHHTRDGRMIALNQNGYTVFDPLSFQIDTTKITPLITHLIVNNQEPLVATETFDREKYELENVVSISKELEFDYLHNNFTLEFSAMEMTAPDKNLYRHKLEGYDPDWIESDYKNRNATYTNLDAGTYTFRVKASNHHGVWSDNERTLRVIILPPPWKSWWAYSIYTVIVLGLLFTARRMIVQRERLQGSLKLAKVEQEKEHFELEKAKEVDRVKTSFFTNISHEFRTPLTLIQGPVQDLLEEYSANSKTQGKLRLVQRNSDLLLKLINQLLDLAKLDAGNLKIEKSKGEATRFIKAIGSSFTSFAAQKSISLNIDVPEEPCYALFDRDKLETILINLINNGIKFTPSHGKVNVGAKVTNSSLLLTVSDTGIGIPVDQHEKIFERFHQVSESHKEVGTGIGLALVKELVSLLGGTIAVKSEVGKGLPGEQTGSEFIVTLPLEIVGAEEHIEAHDQEISVEQPTVHVVQNKISFESATSNGEETRQHVLVVEDNADLRSFIIESLGEEFHFLEAENGRQGFEVATTEIPDLIISDVMMPEMDGITMAEKIKADVRTSHIPLILLTAKSTEANKLTGLESGADDYLTKPFNKHELLLKIRNGITRQRKLREKVMAELMSEAPRKEVQSADEQFLTKVKDEILNQLSNEQLSVESLAEQIGMSRVHLYRKLSGLTGMSVNELIRKLRLHRAAQLLHQQWGPVSQVAYEVGFSNLSYFSKVFKEEFGKLPSEYIKK